MLLNISEINLNGGTQTRAQLNEEHTANLVELIDNGYVLPPVETIYDGSVYWLVDGFHRVAAHKLADKKRIEAKVSQGTKRDAVLRSLSANASHGLPRNNGDKKRAVQRMLRDEEWSEWSNQKIAEICACTPGYVKRIRAENLPIIPDLQIPSNEPEIEPTQRLEAATPGAVVRLPSGEQGTVMGITDGGAIFQVQSEGKMRPMLRTEFTVIAAAKPIDTDTPKKLSRQQQILELKRFVLRISKDRKMPDSVRSEAAKLLALIG